MPAVIMSTFFVLASETFCKRSVADVAVVVLLLFYFIFYLDHFSIAFFRSSFKLSYFRWQEFYLFCV